MPIYADHSSAELSPMDVLMLKGDADPRTRAIMTAILKLDGTPDWATLRAAFERASLAVPRMRQRVARPLLPGLPPEWLPDPEFDLDYHLRRIGAPKGGGMAQVLELAAAMSTSPLDAARPLWEATMVDLDGGKVALVFRAHHALTDGIGAVAVLVALLDLEAGGAAESAGDHSVDADSAGVAGQLNSANSRRLRLQRASASQLRASTRRSVGLVKASTKFAQSPRASLRATADMGGSVRRLATRPVATPSPLLRERSRRRDFRTLEVPLDGLKAAGKTHGCTVNDAYLSAMLGGFRRYFDAHGAMLEDVPLALPISTRPSDNTSAGNYLSMARLSGPASIEDAVERMKAVHKAVAQLRAEPAVSAMDSITDLLQHLPSALAVRGLTMHAQQVDLHASNLAGAPCDVYLAGRRVVSMFPFGPLTGVPVMSVLLSYKGVCEIGLTLDPAAVRNPELFVDCLRESFDEVTAISTRPAPVIPVS